MLNLSGTGVALVTPFTKENTVDVVALEKIVNYVIDGNVEYLVVLGTTAETATLSSSEKQLVIDTVVKTNADRLPLVLGLGGNNTQVLVDELNTGDFSSFDAILSVTPYYNRPNQEGLYQHYTALAKASPLPLILYNVPSRTGVNLLPETVVRLANENENIVAVKEAIGDIEQFKTLIANTPEGFAVISGDDGLALPVTLAGGKGVISVIAGAYPYQISEMIRYGLANNRDEGYEIHNQMIEIVDLIFEEGNPTGIKNLLKHQGLIDDNLRLPLVSASEKLSNKIKATLA